MIIGLETCAQFVGGCNVRHSMLARRLFVSGDAGRDHLCFPFLLSSSSLVEYTDKRHIKVFKCRRSKSLYFSLIFSICG